MTKLKESLIDIVITWTDGDDSDWKLVKDEYMLDNPGLGKSASDSIRYRNFGLLKYWFRSIEQFAPWVHKIYFVTDNQVPEWLNTQNEKLCVVSHDDIMPEDVLPCYNSNAIEMYLHRIPELSEHFLYFNDDMFLLHPVQETDFFQEGKPVAMLALQPDVANPKDDVMPYIYLNNSMVLARHFDKIQNMKEQPGAYFNLRYPAKNFFYNLVERMFPQMTGFYTMHGAAPFLKSTFQEVWEKEGDVLQATGTHRFRSREDVSQYLLQEWQKLSKNFVPRNTEKNFRYFNLSDQNGELLQTIREQKIGQVCINDSSDVTDFPAVKKSLQEAFEQILPERSSFEL